MSSKEGDSKKDSDTKYTFKENKVAQAMLAADVDCGTPLNVTSTNGEAAKITKAMGIKNNQTIRRALGRFMQETGLSAGSE